MFGKLVLVASLALFPVASIAGGEGGGPHGPGGGGGVHGPGGGTGGGPPHGGGGGHFGGHEEHEHFGGDHEHRFWHGRWWGYGEGGCWHLDPFGRYFWVCE